MNLASGDSLRGPRDLKALWEAHVIYCILVLRGNDVSTKVALDYGPTHDASGLSWIGTVCLKFFFCSKVKHSSQKNTSEGEIREKSLLN